MLAVQIGVIITTRKVKSQFDITEMETPLLRVRSVVISAG